jgi:UDP-N-acetylmuramoylalanine--D-glutamate ligase
MAVTAGLKDKKIVVLGAQKGAIEVVKYLIKKGAKVSLVDLGSAELLQPLLDEKLPAGKYEAFFGNEIDPKVFADVERIIVSPKFPTNIAAIEVARSAGVIIETELDFVTTHLSSPLLAVVGSKGKSTTANLIRSMLKKSGKEVFANIEAPLAAALNLAKAPDFVIGVISPIVLEGARALAPEYVVFTNVYDDYLDRYTTAEQYQNLLKEVFRNANEETTTVLNAGDATLLNWMAQIQGKKLLFSAAVPEGFSGAWSTRTDLHVRITTGGVQKDYQASLKNYKMRGVHNRENLMAAALTAMTLGAKFEDVQHVIDDLSTLTGRLEFVKRINSVAFYNDSAATIPHSVTISLKAFAEPIILIAGGRDKGLDFTPLAPLIRQRVKNMILVGEAKEKLNRMIGDFTETFLVGTFEEAVLLAYQKSRSGDVILFSPGCAGFETYHSMVSEEVDPFRILISQIAQPRRLNVL